MMTPTRFEPGETKYADRKSVENCVVRSVIICTAHQIHISVNKSRRGGTCRMHWTLSKNKKRKLIGKVKERDPLGDLSMSGRRIFKP
jgi:hypothetical protein